MRNGVKRPLISDQFEGGGRGHGSTACSESSALPLSLRAANDSVEESPTQSVWSDQRDSATPNAYYALMDLILINMVTSSQRVSDQHLACSFVEITIRCFFVFFQ